LVILFSMETFKVECIYPMLTLLRIMVQHNECIALMINAKRPTSECSFHVPHVASLDIKCEEPEDIFR